MDDDGFQDDSSYVYDGSAPSSVGASPLTYSRTASAFGEGGVIHRGVYKTMDEGALAKKMYESIRQVVSILHVTLEDAFLMLHSTRWSQDSLQEAYFANGGDGTEFRARLGVSATVDPPPAPGAPDDVFTDDVLLCDVRYADADALPCGHFFSKESWQSACTSALESATALHKTCQQSGCNERLRPRMFMTYLSPENKKKYEQAQVRSFAEGKMVFCPARGCTWVVEYSGGGALDVECGAGHEFCYKCKKDIHLPASCSELVLWQKREVDDSEDAKWLSAHTKPCPKCKKPIEKNQGCNHMTCQLGAKGCGYEFCWLCLGAWRNHSSCNKIIDPSLYDPTASAIALSELQEYSFYYERMMEGKKSIMFAAKLLPKIDKMKAAIAKRLPLVDYSVICFLDTAVDVIVRGRRASTYSYVHAFYVPKGDLLYRNLFGDSQSQLEKFLEELHSLIEKTDIDVLLDSDEKATPAASAASSVTAKKAVVPVASSSSSSSSASSAGSNSSSESASNSSSSSSTSTIHLSSEGVMHWAACHPLFNTWRNKTNDALCATAKYIKQLLDAVEAGLLNSGSFSTSSSSSSSSSGNSAASSKAF